MRPLQLADLVVEPHPVTHTSHTCCGYLLRTPIGSGALAPEFWDFPSWAPPFLPAPIPRWQQALGLELPAQFAGTNDVVPAVLAGCSSATRSAG